MIISQLSASNANIVLCLCSCGLLEDACLLALSGLRLSFRAVGRWEVVRPARTQFSCLLGVQKMKSNVLYRQGNVILSRRDLIFNRQVTNQCRPRRIICSTLKKKLLYLPVMKPSTGSLSFHLLNVLRFHKHLCLSASSITISNLSHCAKIEIIHPSVHVSIHLCIHSYIRPSL